MFLHQKSQLLLAAREARRLDPRSQRRAFKPLSISLNHGQTVSFYFDSQELIAKETIGSVTWYGDPDSVVFEVQIPNNAKGETVSGCIYLSVDDVPIGEIEFELLLEHSKAQPAESMPLGFLQQVDDAPKSVGSAARHYKKAFLSYARKDIAWASVFAEGLTSNEIELFVDLMTMEPGDEWAPKLIEAIEGSDVFFLLWSHNAAESEWVAKECLAACTRHTKTSGTQPSIRPIVIDDGASTPPYCISKFHCDSRWRHIRIAGKKSIFSESKDATGS